MKKKTQKNVQILNLNTFGKWMQNFMFNFILERMCISTRYEIANEFKNRFKWWMETEASEKIIIYFHKRTQWTTGMRHESYVEFDKTSFEFPLFFLCFCFSSPNVIWNDAFGHKSNETKPILFIQFLIKVNRNGLKGDVQRWGRNVYMKRRKL